MQSVLLAESTVLLQFKLGSLLPFVFGCIVISLLAVRASQRNSLSHLSVLKYLIL